MTPAQELLNQFRLFLKDLKGPKSRPLSSVTVKNYVSDIRKFLSWLDENSPLAGVTTTSQRSYLDNFTPDPLHSYPQFIKSTLPTSSYNRHLASLRRFTTFLSIKHHINISLPTTKESDFGRNGRNPVLKGMSTATNSSQVNQQKSYISTDLLQNFRSYLQSQELSHSTVKNYSSDINHFLAWSAKFIQKNITQEDSSTESNNNLSLLLTSLNLKTYSNYLKLTHTGQSVINRRISAIKKLTQFALSANLITHNPFSTPRFIKPLKPLAWLQRTSAQNSSKPTIQPTNSKGLRSSAKNLYRHYHSLPFTPYLHLALLVLFTATLGIFGYNQVIKQAPSSQAYPTALNAPTRQLSFQGRLTDSSDNPITTSTNVVFKLFDAVTAGSELYSSSTCSVDPDQDGIFNVLIGDTTCGAEISSDVFTENTAVWLEVTVGAETLDPRQQIATVAFALNSETLQGYPPGTTASTIPYIDSSGNIGIGATSPTINSTAGIFKIQGQALTLATASTSDGNITLQPDGTGQILAIGGTTTGDTIRVTNANLTSGDLISGYIGNNTATGNLLNLSSGTSETDQFTISRTGQAYIAGMLGIGTTAPTYELDLVGEFNLTDAIRVAGDAGTSGYLLTSSAGGANTWTDPTSIGTTTFLGLTDTPSGYTTGSVLFTSGSAVTEDNTNFFWDDSNNRLGIGTTAPSQQLELTGDLKIGGDDLFMTTNTDAYLLVADGTNYNPVAMSGDVSITNAGVTAIGDDKITEADLKLVNSATDEYCLTYETTTGDFEWQTCSSGSITGTGTDNYLTRWNAAGTGLENGTLVDNATIGISLNIDSSNNVGIGGTAANTTPSLYITAAGNIGIGTTAPTRLLDILGDMRLDGQLYDENNIVGTPGQVLSTTATGTDWVDASGGTTTFLGLTDTPSGYTAGSVLFTSGSAVTEDNANFFWDDSNNRLGIGTTAPGAELDVTGHIWQTGTGKSVFLGEGAGANDDLSDNLNVFIGYETGNTNTGGIRNTASGYQSLYTNATGNDNTASGYYSLYTNNAGYSNTAYGNQSLYTNSSGYYNTASGYKSLYSNTTGYYNTASGGESLYTNNAGYRNTASGYVSLRSNTTGDHNTASGNASLYANTTGNNNTASGYYSLYPNSTGYSNTASGYQAGRYISGGSIGNQTSNTSLYLGADTKALASGDTNEIVIGYNTTGFGSNTSAYGNSSITKHIFQAGNIGIGTTAPATLLELSDGTYGGSDWPVLSLNRENGVVITDVIGELRFKTTDVDIQLDKRDLASIRAIAESNFNGTLTNDTGLAFFTVNSSDLAEALRIDKDGNLGIGTTAPGYLLEVAGTSQFDSTVNFANGTTYKVDASGNATFLDIIATDTGNPGITVGNGSIGAIKIGSSTITDNSTTYLGIDPDSDTTSEFQFQDDGDFWTESGSILSGVADSASAVAFTLDTDNALSTYGSKLLSVSNNGTEKMYLDKDGNLYVSGNIITGSGGYTLLVTNKSGGTVATKAVVVIDESNNSAFTTTTTPYTQGAFGVVVGVGLGVANDADSDGVCDADDICIVAVNGEADITTTNAASASVGDYVFTSDTAGSAVASGKQYDGLVGIVTDVSGSGSGYVKIVFKAQPQVTAIAAMDKYTKHNIYQEALEDYLQTSETDYYNNNQNTRKGLYFDALLDKSKIDYSSNTAAIDTNNRKAGLWGGATLNATNTDSAGNTYLGAADANDVYYYDRTQNGKQGRDSTPATQIDLGIDPYWYNGISLVNPATGSGTLANNPTGNLTEWYNGGLIKVDNTITTEDGYIDIEIVSQTTTTLTFNWRTSQGVTYSGDQLDTAIFGQATSLVDDTSATDTNIDVTFTKVNYHSGDTFRIASWYIEPATTNDRGSKQQFPEHSNIIGTSAGADIIDADTNLLWMRFKEDTGATDTDFASIEDPETVVALNGKVTFGSAAATRPGMSLINFISDDTGKITNSGYYIRSDKSGISTRNEDSTVWAITNSDLAMVDAYANDISTAVIPNQPTQEITVGGWGYIQGDNSRTLNETVNLPYKFNNSPIVATAHAGRNTSAVPTSISDCTDAQNVIAIDTQDITTSSFLVGLRETEVGGTLTATSYYCYTWTATGTVSPKQFVAVATGSSGVDGGTSIINETDGTAVDVSLGSQTTNVWWDNKVTLTSKGDLHIGSREETASYNIINNYHGIAGITSDETSFLQHRSSYYLGGWEYSLSLGAFIDEYTTTDPITSLEATEKTSTLNQNDNTIYIGTKNGTTVIQENNNCGSVSSNNICDGNTGPRGSVKYYTKDYISEEMVGDIRGMWPLNGNNTASDFEDVSVKGNVLTGTNITSADAVSGVRGEAYDFDGSTEYLSCTDASCGGTSNLDGNSTSTTAWTVGAWFKTSTDNSSIIWKNPVNTAYGLFVESGTVTFRIITTDIDSSTTVTDDQWHYAVGTYDGANMNMYIDGVLEATRTYSGGIPNVAGDFTIGAYKDGGGTPGYYMNGLIDEPFVTAEALSASQIKRMYEVGKRALEGSHGTNDYQNELAEDTSGTGAINNVSSVGVDWDNEFMYVAMEDGDGDNDGWISKIDLDSDTQVQSFTTTTDPSIPDDDATSLSVGYGLELVGMDGIGGANMPLDSNGNNTSGSYYSDTVTTDDNFSQAYLWVNTYTDDDDSSNSVTMYASNDGGSTWVQGQNTGTDSNQSTPEKEYYFNFATPNSSLKVRADFARGSTASNTYITNWGITWIDSDSVASGAPSGGLYTQSDATVANGDYVEIVHNGNTSDLLSNGWIYDTAQSKWVQINTTDSFTATGGTITYDGDYTIHTFTSSGTFTPTTSGNVEVLVVAGGGGGGDGRGVTGRGGGGGAGGVTYYPSYAVTSGGKTVTIGGGGSAVDDADGANGSNSVFDSLTTTGGGGGGDAWGNIGLSGGSGGGGGGNPEGTDGAGTDGQGHDGSAGINSAGGGGGGASIAATDKNGGDGTSYSISGSASIYGGGGGGGNDGTGGAGGGGATTINGTANTGGGGGGGDNVSGYAGGNGGSGIVIVRYISPFTIEQTDTNTIRLYNNSGTTQNLRLDAITGAGSSNAGYVSLHPLAADTDASINGSSLWINKTGAGGNILRLQANDSDKFTITVAGNVGIGTTAPTRLLDVLGDMRLDGQLYDENNAVGTPGQVLSTTATGTDWVDASSGTTTFLGLTDTPSGYTTGSVLFTSGSAVTEDNANFFWNDSSNRLGIGTTAPGNKLDVAGTVEMTGFKLTTSPTNGYVLTTDAAGVGTWQTRVDGSGTDNYLARWNAAGTGIEDGTLIDASTTGISLYIDTSNNVGIGGTAANTAPSLYIAATGNIGIGTTNPQSKLEIAGSTSTLSNDSGDITLNAASNFISLAGDSLGNLLDLSVAGDASISGSIAFDGVSPSTINILNGNSFNFQTSPGGDVGLSPVMSISNSGNLGIGTTNPLFKLEVAGTSQFDDQVNFANGTTYYIDNSGNAKFHDIIAADTGNPGITIGNGSIGSIKIGSSTITDNSTSFLGLDPDSDGTSEMVITDSGYLGIGTSSPSSPLSVNGGISAGTYAAIAAPSNGMIISGNVGIGTTSPATKLEVKGTASATYGVQYINANGSESSGVALMIKATTSAFSTYGTDRYFLKTRISTDNTRHSLRADGQAYADGSWNGGGADVAEWMPTSEAESLEPGDIIMIDNNSENSLVKKSEGEPYLSKAIGVVSTEPGLVSGSGDTEDEHGQNDILVALAGRVPVKVSLENGPIYAGDPLTNSSQPGVAMKATKPGIVIGRAFENYEAIGQLSDEVINIENYRLSRSPELEPIPQPANGIGKIMLFINTSYYDPDIYLTNTGHLNIEQASSNVYQLKDTTTNTTIGRISAFAEVVTASFQAGIATIQDLTTNTLTVTGTLISPVAYIEDLEVNTITAQTINAPQISQIEQEILDLTAKYSTASAILADIQATQALDPIIATGSDLDVNQIITNDLQVNNSLITNLINSKDQDTLFLQPLATAPINLLAGLMTLTSDGQVIINGDLAVTGKVLASKIEALESNLENLTAQTATISALTTKQLIIATSAVASESATATPSAHVASNNIVNSATLPASSTELTIQNTNITQDTYIYLTAQSDTQNQVLYIKSQEPGSFTVSINLPQLQDIKLNYWLIQTIPAINNTNQ